MTSAIANSLARFVADESGASASEYAILLSVVAAVILAATKLFDLRDVYNLITGKVSNCVNASGNTC